MKKCNIPHAPSTNFQHLKVFESMIPKNKKKYYNTEVEYGATFKKLFYNLLQEHDILNFKEL